MDAVVADKLVGGEGVFMILFFALILPPVSIFHFRPDLVSIPFRILSFI